MERKQITELETYVNGLPETDGDKKPREQGIKIVEKAKIQAKYITLAQNDPDLLKYHEREYKKYLSWEYGVKAQRSEYADKIQSAFGKEKPESGSSVYEKVISIYSDTDNFDQIIDLIKKTYPRLIVGKDHFRPSVVGKSKDYADKIEQVGNKVSIL